jgi:CRP-like cAMP-binding protein
MTIQPADLRAIPLFRDIKDAQLGELIKAFERETLPAGKTLFQVGEVPTRLVLLAKGEVSLMEGTEERFRLRPLAPIGELGSMTSHPRNVTAVTATEVELLSVGVPKLLAYFESHGPLGMSFYQNLLSLVSDKVRRDEMRLEQMRHNIIRTQKAMKKLRELVLASVETEISKPIFEGLEDLIEHNRRAHYRVVPHPKFAANVRMDDGTVASVNEVSDGFLKVVPGTPMPPNGEFWSAVLVMPLGEMPVSGMIQRTGPDGVVVRLDGFIDDYRRMLEDYMTRLQLLDFVI